MWHAPPPPLLLQVYGVLLFQEGRVGEAREVLRRGVSHNPGNPQLCMEWALSEQQAGNLGEIPAVDGEGWDGGRDTSECELSDACVFCQA